MVHKCLAWHLCRKHIVTFAFCSSFSFALCKMLYTSDKTVLIVYTRIKKKKFYLFEGLQKWKELF